jgi:hypothetical protein
LVAYGERLGFALRNPGSAVDAEAEDHAAAEAIVGWVQGGWMLLQRAARLVRVTTPTILVATWGGGLYAVAEATGDQEMPGQSVRALAPDGHGGALAIVGGSALRRRDPAGVWSTLAVSKLALSCCVAMGDAIYVGTDDARVLRVEAGGRVEPLRSFDTVAGRDKWYAGTALINGQLMGPPLGIRSITATLDGALLANVHVGGIPRSVDRGATWAPTIDVDTDVHEVRAHPSSAGVVMAAAAVGLCTSRDGGATWDVEEAGLHARYCSAIGFAGDDVLVAAATDHFAPEGAIYRRRVDGPGPLALVGKGLPTRIDGIADTGCIAGRGGSAAVCDKRGNLYVSADAGQTWSRRAVGMPPPSSVLIV